MREKQLMKSPSSDTRRRGQRLGIVALALALVGLGACEDGALTDIDGDGDADDLSIESLVITAADEALVEGGTSHFQAQARAAADVPIDTATITWTSRDESVATVGASTGTVTAVMEGETYIVAQTGSGDAVLTDSVLLTVEMPALSGTGQAEIRIRGEDFTESYSWEADVDMDEARLTIQESMGGDEHDVAWLEIFPESAGDETGITVVFPRTGSITEGTLDLSPFDTGLFYEAEHPNDVLDSPTAVFMANFDEGGYLYAATEGTITIESVSGEAGYTSATAEEVTARIDMTAEGYTFDEETEEFSATGETVHVTALVSVEYVKAQVAYATASITSGDTQMDLTVNETDMDRFEDEFSFSIYATDTEGQEWYLRTVIIDPAVGSTWAYAVSEPWNYEGTRVYGDHLKYDAATDEYQYVQLYSDGGEIILEQYVDAPRPDGVVEGTVSILLGEYDGTVHTGEQVMAEIYFIAPSQEQEDEEFYRASTAADRDVGIRRILRSQRAPAQIPADRIR